MDAVGVVQTPLNPPLVRGDFWWLLLVKGTSDCGRGVVGEEGFDECFGFEWGDVGGGFAEADEFDGDIDLIADADDDPALGAAVQFGEEQAGHVHVLAEDFGLIDGVLADG